MSAHTPGPWVVEEYGDEDTPTLVIHRGETETRICFMATPGSHDDPAAIVADAYLIAAAPDMLAALRKAHDFLDSHGTGWDEDDTFEIIRLALAKSESRS